MKKDYIDNGYSAEQADEFILHQMGKASGTKKGKNDISNYDNTPKDFDPNKKNGGRIYKFGGKVYFGALQELNF
jgi:hypothetical protein